MNKVPLLAISLAAAAAYGTPALAEETPPYVRAPWAPEPAPVSLAVSYELKFWHSDGTTLAELLLQAGVNADDATLADKLGAGHDGGCFVRVTVTKPLGSSDYRLQRLMLISDRDQTVMERREGQLAITSTGRPTKALNTLV